MPDYTYLESKKGYDKTVIFLKNIDLAPFIKFSVDAHVYKPPVV